MRLEVDMIESEKNNRNIPTLCHYILFKWTNKCVCFYS